MLVKLTSSDTMVEREPPEVIPELPRLRSFDISVLFDHMLDEGAWRSDLKRLGIDTTKTQTGLTMAQHTALTT